MMEDTYYRWRKDNYLHPKPPKDTAVKKPNSFELHLLGYHDSEGVIKKDDFWGYARGDPIKVTSLEVRNLISWW
jgi:hypothetical protein